MASFGPSPLTVISRSKSRSPRDQESEERNLVLAHLRMNMQRGLKATEGRAVKVGTEMVTS